MSVAIVSVGDRITPTHRPGDAVTHHQTLACPPLSHRDTTDKINSVKKKLNHFIFISIHVLSLVFFFNLLEIIYSHDKLY